MKTELKPELFIFDLDGTLIDSAIVISNILNEMRCSRNLGPLDATFYRTYISRGISSLISFSLLANDENLPKLTSEFRDRYLEIQTSHDYLYPNAHHVIKSIYKHKKSLAICSNKPEKLCVKILNDLGILNFFNLIVGGDTTPKPKPSRDPVDYILENLNFSYQDAIFIGDSTIDQSLADSVGMSFVFFSGGYDDGVNLLKVENKINDLNQILERYI